MSDRTTPAGTHALPAPTSMLGSTRAPLLLATLLSAGGLALGLAALSAADAAEDVGGMLFAGALTALILGAALALWLAFSIRSRVTLLVGAMSQRQAELHAAVDAAASANEALRVCVEGSSEGKLLLDDKVVALVNPAAAAIVGKPTDRLLGLPVEEALAETFSWAADGRPLDGATWLPRLLEGPMTIRYSPDGERERWLELAAATEDGARVLVTARDITDARRLQSVRDEFLQLIMHDLRSPLTVINGYLDILRRPLPAEARERAIDAAKLNSDKMAALLDDLAHATGAEELLAPRDRTAVSLSALARDVAASLPEAVTRHPLEVTAEGSPVVLGEERRLRQALANLVTNSLKYAPDGTPVRIRVTADGLTALLSVEDEGPGIPPEHRGTVFERFERLETARDKPGLGLGLHIVNVVAATHGGSVRIEDAPGGGARFVIELPLAEDGYA